MKIKIPKTIQKLAPLWTRKIKKRFSYGVLRRPCVIDNIELDITDWQSCIVGETLNLIDGQDWNEYQEEYKILHAVNDQIHDWTLMETTYHKGCMICVRFSRRFHNIIVEYDFNSRADQDKSFEKALKSYANHMTTRHKKLCRSKGVEFT